MSKPLHLRQRAPRQRRPRGLESSNCSAPRTDFSSYRIDIASPELGVKANPSTKTKHPSMNSSIHTWQLAMSKAPVNDFEDAISNFSSDNELEEDLLPHQGAEMNLATQVAFWNKETLVSCICGALPDSYCTCLPTSLDFAPDNDYFEHQPLQNQTHNSHHSDRFSSSSTTSDPQVSRLSGKTPAPTRKEVSWILLYLILWTMCCPLNASTFFCRG